jgi:hypothetical protein
MIDPHQEQSEDIPEKLPKNPERKREEPISIV